jgi:signal transduction histidine kinase
MILAIFGFRSTTKVAIIGMVSGFATTLAFYFVNSEMNGIAIGLMVNALVMLISHYAFKQKGGWVGVKDDRALKTLRIEHKQKWLRIVRYIKNFSLYRVCVQNQPRSEGVYVRFGLFCIISTFSAMYSMPDLVAHKYSHILDFIYNTVLTLATTFLSYPMWPKRFKKDVFIVSLWHISLFYILVMVGGIFVLLSNFAQFPLMIFTINLVVLAILTRWQLALPMIILGGLLLVKFVNIHMNDYQFTRGSGDLQFKISYSLLLLSSVLLAFVKPKQDMEDIIDEQNKHLHEAISERDKELHKSLTLKHEFLRNINHEIRAPVTAIAGLSEMMLENFDSMEDEKRKEALHYMSTSSLRLSSLVNNLLDMSSLTNLKTDLQKEAMDFTTLVYERIEKCRKLYANNKEVEFIMDLAPEVIIKGDVYYLSQILDNIIINAIHYTGSKSEIVVSLYQEGNKARLTVLDNGIGIPKTDLDNIFHIFMVSSKTRSKAGGRGVGLALCKKVIDLHNGRIWAESDGHSWSKFCIVL